MSCCPSRLLNEKHVIFWIFDGFFTGLQRENLFFCLFNGSVRMGISVCIYYIYLCSGISYFSSRDYNLYHKCYLYGNNRIAVIELFNLLFSGYQDC